MKMAQKCFIFAMLLFAFVSAWSQSKHRIPTPPTRFVIDENRAYIYLLFDHVGTGIRMSEDEPTGRVWFRFVNNCNIGIALRTFGLPEGSLKDEVGLIHNVVKDAPQLRVRSDIDNDPPVLNAQPELRQETNMPTGYNVELSSKVMVQPGRSLLFSVPVTHLSKSWHIEIPYTFDVPPGKGPRPPIVGGQPRMVLEYSAWDLPEDIQKQLPRIH